MECLLENHDHISKSSGGPPGLTDPKVLKQVQESVRMPSTLKWVRKLKQHRRNLRNNNSNNMQGNENGKKKNTDNNNSSQESRHASPSTTPRSEPSAETSSKRFEEAQVVSGEKENRETNTDCRFFTFYLQTKTRKRQRLQSNA